MMRAILTFSILLLVVCLTSCRDIPELPIKNVWEVELKQGSKECYKYTITSKDPIQVSDGVLTDVKDCPQYIFGFEGEHDTAEMFSYIRELQDIAKRKCQ